MATIPTPIKHVYKEVNKGRYLTTKHFELVEVINGKQTLSNKLNLSVNRNCALSMPEYWIKERELKKWSKNALTGLFKTNKGNLFYGDSNKRTNLLIFKFCNNKETLIVYQFSNYHTKNINQIISLING